MSQAPSCAVVGRAVGRKSPDEVLNSSGGPGASKSIGALVGACALVIAATARPALGPRGFRRGRRGRTGLDPSAELLPERYSAGVKAPLGDRAGRRIHSDGRNGRGVIAGGGISGMFAVEAAAAVTMLICMAAVARRLRPAGVATRLAHDERRTVTRFALLTSGGVILTSIVYRRSEFL